MDVERVGIIFKEGDVSARKRNLIFFIVIVGVIVVLFAISLYQNRGVHVTKYDELKKTTHEASRAPTGAPTAEDEKMLKDLMESGIVESVNANMNEATVDPASWARMKFDAKKHLGWFLATYCGKKKGTGLNWVDILDSYSGKKLAKYSEAYGFKVY